MCDIQNNGKIQREFETRSTDDQPTIQWLPVVGSWTFLGVNMHFNEKLFMCDSCNFLVRAYHNARPGHRAADKMRNGPRISWSWCGHAVGGDTGQWPPGHSCQQNIHSHSCASFLISEQ